MLGISDAQHEETAPGAPNLAISELACSLVGQAQTVRIMPNTLSRQVYGKEETIEEFRCSYGLNPEYRDKIGASGLQVAGVGPDGEVRMVELSDHRFFVATLFLPQLSSSPDRPHRLIVAYLQAAAAFRRTRSSRRQYE